MATDTRLLRGLNQKPISGPLCCRTKCVLLSRSAGLSCRSSTDWSCLTPNDSPLLTSIIQHALPRNMMLWRYRARGPGGNLSLLTLAVMSKITRSNTKPAFRCGGENNDLKAGGRCNRKQFPGSMWPSAALH